MPDIFLYSGEPNPNDIRLGDPSALRGGGGSVTYSYAGTGGLLFAGSGELSKTKVPSVSGGVLFAGTSAVSRSRTFIVSGGLTLAGAGAYARAITYTASGGVLFAGTSEIAITHVPPASGGKTFGGAAATSFVPAAGAVVYTYAGTGGMTFTGSSASEFVAAPVVGTGGGWITWTVDRAFRRNLKKVEDKKQPEPRAFEFSPRGGFAFGGSAKVSRTRHVVARISQRRGRAASPVSFSRIAKTSSPCVTYSGRARHRLVSVPVFVPVKRVDTAAIVAAARNARRTREEAEVAMIFSTL